MGRYNLIDTNWFLRSTKVGDWKAGMLIHRSPGQYSVKDAHIIASDPSLIGNYSDAHITLVAKNNEKHHIYYQVNNDELVANYVLAPNGWRDSAWVFFPNLRKTAEREALNFVRYWRSEGRLTDPPAPVD